MSGIYVHIPFCVRKCRYCDFYSVTDRALAAPFVAALTREIECSEPFPEPPDTLYFGGGTPSVLAPEAIGGVFDAVQRNFLLPDDAETTLEVNPGTVTLETLKAYRDIGINRLNIGVQSFDDSVLSFLGRCHDGREARRAISWARDAGFENIGIDLIYGLPGQSLQAWRETLEEGLTFQPEHFSCYILTYEEGTPLYRMRSCGHFDPLDEDATADLFDTTVAVLSNAEYLHYEISNFSRGREMRSRHNWKYWMHIPYRGFGPAAHSFSGRKRSWNIEDVSEYIHRLMTGQFPVDEAETLTREQLMTESIYLGLRTGDGIDLNRFERRYGVRFEERFSPLVDLFTREDLLTLSKERCAPTRRGMRFHDFLTQRFVDEMA